MYKEMRRNETPYKQGRNGGYGDSGGELLWYADLRIEMKSGGLGATAETRDFARVGEGR